jgi:hypothetical protein
MLSGPGRRLSHGAGQFFGQRSEAYTSFTVKIGYCLVSARHDILESVCAENGKDRIHPAL